MKADETRRARDQYCPIRHRILKASVRLHRTGRDLFTRRMQGAAIPSYAAIARLALKPYQGDEVRRAVVISRLLATT
jgi:hypothetical protein